MNRFYRLLLRAYPRWFRERYEAELVEAFAADREHPRYTGVAGTCRFWLAIISDLSVSSFRARAHARRGTRSSSHRKGGTMDALVQDLRHAARQLARRPGFTAVAVLSLALGIGGSAIIIAFFDGFVFNPFAYPEPERIVAIGSTFPRVSSEERFVEAISVPELEDIRRARTIESIAAFDLGNRNISGGDRPERVFTALALTDLFGPFGLRPALGRGFTPDELAPRGPRAAIISYRLWQRRFGADPAIVGRSVRVNGTPTTVVGVMPQELLLLGTDLWLPLPVEPGEMPRNARPFTLVGRLAPGATLEQANVELSTIAAQTIAQHAARFHEYAEWRLAAVPWARALMREIRPVAYLLLGAVGMVLLLVCANLSNLILARSSTRRRELAVRLALGAGRARIASHLLAEVALLATAGGCAGLLLAMIGLPALVSLVPPQLNTVAVTASINPRVLAWAGLLTIGSAMLVGLLPLVHATRGNPVDGLQIEGRGSTTARAQLGLRHALIVAEIAASVVLLVGAGLMIHSVLRLQAVEPGFDARNVLTQAFVSRFLPGAEPLGQRITAGPDDRPSPPTEIVGVVRNTRNADMRSASAPEIFVPLDQQAWNNQLFLLVRTDGEPMAVLPSVRERIAAVDPEQPIYSVRTLEDAIAANTFGVRFPMILLALFATVALTLAALGIYGVMSYAVSARTQEIGVRVAVGADRRSVMWLVLRQVVRLTAIGLAAGLAIALGAGGAIRRALFEVQPTDPLTLAAVALVLGAVALAAGWLPAWRASRVDPVNALRDE